MDLMSLEDAAKGQLQKHNNTHFTLVDGMSKLMSQKVKQVQSSDFHVSGIKWRMYICSGAVKDYLSIYMWIRDERCIGSNWEVKFTLKFSVVSPTGTLLSSKPLVQYCFKPKNPYQGVSSFMSYTALNEKYIVNDKAVFGAEITDVRPSFTVTRIARAMGTADRVKLIQVARNNSRFTWKITQFSSFNDTTHSSYEFTVGPRRWKLEMCPKGDTAEGKYFCLSLTATKYVTNGPQGGTLAIYKLRVLDQLKGNHYETKNINYLHYDPMDPIKGVEPQKKFLPLEELHNASRGYLVNDEIYLGVEFLFYSTTEYL